MKSRILTLCVGVTFLASVAWGQIDAGYTPRSNTPERSVAASATTPCNAPAGARFNLEPRAKASAQNQPNADFLLHRTGPNDDLIVQVANDFRGNLTTTQWDGSVSGYYVHRSTTADCSVQFEGGLPPFTSGGVTYHGVGNPVVAADPARDALFVADSRTGPTTTQSGTALFRISASTLLDPKACPNGTHNAAEATLCWGATPPVLISGDFGGFPQVSVDERSNNAGKGAGDVYVLGLGVVNNANALTLVACTNSLSCGSPMSIPGATNTPGFEYMKVRTDGVITISFANITSGLTGLQADDIFYVTCTPAGAPNPPACGTPTLVTHVTSPINSSFSPLFPLTNINMLMFTYPKHATRAEAGGKFTTFLVYDDCKSSIQFQKPPISACVDSEVVLLTSTDDGKTWSSPVSVDTTDGHHFYPSIATDTSTGIIHIAYYSTDGDSFHHEVGVVRNQILPGSTSLSKPIAVTTVRTAIDLPPQNINQSQSDFFMGVVARGDSITGQSHLYTSFDSTAVLGTYNGRSLRELNNHISMVTY